MEGMEKIVLMKDRLFNKIVPKMSGVGRETVNRSLVLREVMEALKLNKTIFYASILSRTIPEYLATVSKSTLYFRLETETRYSGVIIEVLEAVNPLKFHVLLRD